MKNLLLVGFMGLSLISGSAYALQDQTAPVPADQVPPEAPAEETAATETDLGSSIDDLLEGDFAAPAEGGLTDYSTPEEELAAKVRYEAYQHATLRALDKITGRSTDIDVVADTPIVFGSLKIEMRACYQTPPELPPESAAFLQVSSTQAVRVATMEDGVDASEVSTVNDDNPRLFSGWMFASSPGLSALEHPVYDVWVIKCNAA